MTATVLDNPHAAVSAPEQRVLAAVSERQIADFSDQPAGETRLRAEFLQALIAGSRADWPDLCAPLRIRGAAIEGALRPPTSRSSSEHLHALLFWSCTFDQPVDVSGADFLSLRFVDCDIPAFIGASLSTKADLDLSGSRLTGVADYQAELADIGACSVYLNNARIGGRLDMSATAHSRFHATGTVSLDGARIEGDIALEGAHLDGSGEPALSARSLTAGGNVLCTPRADHRFEALGEVVFVAARITGDLNLAAAQLVNPDGRALHCEDLTVESVIVAARDDVAFEAHGRLNFLSATIGGSFFLANARLAPGPDYTGLIGKGGPVCANLQQLRVSNALVMANVGALNPDQSSPSAENACEPVRGWFLLTGAQLNSIFDDVETGWPARGYLDLEGLTYERLRNVRGGDIVETRLAWLARQYPDAGPSTLTFRPQPYEELSRVLRAQGQAREADAIAVEKIRQRLAAKVDGPWARALPKLLMLLSNHGYSSSRAALSFLVFVMFGTAMYAAALWGFGQPFLPIETSPEPVDYVFAFGLATQTTQHGCPGLDVIHYALDAALPVIELGQTSLCRFAPDGPARWAWSLAHSVYMLAGAALSAIVVLTLTGVLRRD